MNEVSTLQLVIQGGAVGISIALIGLVYFIVKSVTKVASNHLVHLNETLMRMTKAIEKLCTSMDKNK